MRPRGTVDARSFDMAEEKHEEQQDTTVEIDGETTPRNGPASDGAIGGSAGKGGGISSFTATGNEKIPPRAPKK